MQTASRSEVLDALRIAGTGIDAELLRILQSRPNNVAEMYDMLSYSLGFDGTGSQSKGGKRFRPALCLLIAESYGARESAWSAALSIELFHNFTLIHDDIEDRDEMRRGRPTLWKLRGINHGINSGDALSIIAAETALESGEAAPTLLRAFREVIEGQYLDFELADAPQGSALINEHTYLSMISKKTAALIGASAECAGITTDQDIRECDRLREFGISLGIAFQLADDYRSVWSSPEQTGKDAFGDIREHKRTLPFLTAVEYSNDRQRLQDLFAKDSQLSPSEITEARSIIDATPAQEIMRDAVRAHSEDASRIAMSLSIPHEMRAILAALPTVLIPEIS